MYVLNRRISYGEIDCNLYKQRKSQIKSVDVIENFGLKNDAYGGKWHKQVSLLEKEKNR